MPGSNFTVSSATSLLCCRPASQLCRGVAPGWDVEQYILDEEFEALKWELLGELETIREKSGEDDRLEKNAVSVVCLKPCAEVSVVLDVAEETIVWESSVPVCSSIICRSQPVSFETYE